MTPPFSQGPRLKQSKANTRLRTATEAGCNAPACSLGAWEAEARGLLKS